MEYCVQKVYFYQRECLWCLISYSYPLALINMSRQALKTISLLWVGSLLGAGCAFLIQIVLARHLEPFEFGNFSAAFATVALFTPLAGFGISQYWLKVFGQEGWGATRWLRGTFHFIIISTLSVFALLVIWSLLGPHDKSMQFILLALSFYIFGQVAIELVGSKLQLEERYTYLAIWQLLPHLMRLIFVSIFAFLLKESLTGEKVVLVYAVISILFAVLGGFQLLHMTKGNFDLKGHLVKSKIINTSTINLRMLISQVWPFGLAGLFHLIYFQSDIILVKYITGAEAAGVYNVAFTIMVAVLIFPGIVYQKFLLPKMHRWAHHDRKRFYQVYRQGNVIMLLLGTVAMLLIWVIAPWGVPFLFGEAYQDAISLLMVLAVSTPILFLASSVGATLVTQEHMKRKVKYMGTVALINIVLNIILIPSFGAYGAAIATVLSNMILLSMYYTAAKKIVFMEENMNLKNDYKNKEIII